MQIYVLPDEVRPLILYPPSRTIADAKIKQVLRDVKDRGRDIEGCIKQWTSFVKPNFQRHVQPQRESAGAFQSLDMDHHGIMIADTGQTSLFLVGLTTELP